MCSAGGPITERHPVRFRSLVPAVLVAAFAAALVSVGPASAHDALASSSPAADTTIDGSVDRVTLTFSEPPLSGLETGIVISVTGADGAEHSSGSVRVDGNTLSKSVDLTTAGAYDVTWRSVSTDGHPISGSFRFTSQGAATPTPTPTASGTPTSAVASPTPSSSATPAAAPVHDHGQAGALWVIGGLALLAVVVALVVRVVNRRRPTPAE